MKDDADNDVWGVLLKWPTHDNSHGNNQSARTPQSPIMPLSVRSWSSLYRDIFGGSRKNRVRTLRKADSDWAEFTRFSREIELYRQYEIDTSCDLGAGLTAVKVRATKCYSKWSAQLKVSTKCQRLAKPNLSSKQNLSHSDNRVTWQWISIGLNGGLLLVRPHAVMKPTVV